MVYWYLLVFSVLLLVYAIGFFIQSQKKIIFTAEKDRINPREITVLIPFRNEAENLPYLLQSIQALRVFPAKFIFINDHSEDDSCAKLTNLKLPVLVEMVALPADEEGKKSALRLGISRVQTEFVLTWDADICVPSTYFEALRAEAKTDLLILPVSMPANSFASLFYELDYQHLNALNYALAGFTNSIVASGANLLFRRSSFEAYDSYESHADLASGDDQFLLQDFKENGAEVEVCVSPNLIVTTNPPADWKQFLKQRLRWISKSNRVGDSLANGMAVVGVLYHLGFFLLLFTLNSWFDFKLLLAVKISMDFFLFIPYLLKIKRGIALVVWPLFSIVYPIYMLVIFVLLLFYEPDWKGRKI